MQDNKFIQNAFFKKSIHPFLTPSTYKEFYSALYTFHIASKHSFTTLYVFLVTSYIHNCIIDIDMYTLSVCLRQINAKTAEQIGPEFFVGPHMTPVKVYGGSVFPLILIFLKENYIAL